MKSLFASVVRALAWALMIASVYAAEPVKVLIIGDSTVSNYPPEHRNRGWGQFIGGHFKPEAVTIFNRAVPGRSTKTFIEQKLWAKALAEKPAWVLIQFGHNDAHGPDKPESTDAATTYREFLRRYVEEARAAGATPVFVTPMVRRNYTTDGQLDDNLLPYADAMKTVAEEKKVGVIDLHASSRAYMEKLGQAKAQTIASRSDDTTHFNEAGARAMADLVAKDLNAAAPGLGALLQTP